MAGYFGLRWWLALGIFTPSNQHILWNPSNRTSVCFISRHLSSFWLPPVQLPAWFPMIVSTSNEKLVQCSWTKMPVSFLTPIVNTSILNKMYCGIIFCFQNRICWQQPSDYSLFRQWSNEERDTREGWGDKGFLPRVTLCVAVLGVRQRRSSQYFCRQSPLYI